MSQRHLASGSFLGYLYQIERALWWLSMSEVEFIGLETEDDIVAKFSPSEDYEKVLEQAKNSISNSYPFSNKSEDLWKTLHIWANGIMNEEIDLSNTKFSLVTNQRLPSNRLIRKIIEAINPEEREEYIANLLKIADNPSSKIAEYCKTIKKIERDKLNQLLSNITIHSPDDGYDINIIKMYVRKNLGISERSPFNGMYDTLLGFVVAQAISSWRCKDKFTLSREELLIRSNELISIYKSKSFREKAADTIPVSRDQIKVTKKALFVKQLEEINCADDEILGAINDYLRAESEKARYAFDGEISKTKFIEYYDDLKGYWIRVFRRENRLNNHLSDIDRGYSVYTHTIDYKGKLNGYEPEQHYTYQGAYHYLADQPDIGWISNWEDLYKD